MNARQNFPHQHARLLNLLVLLALLLAPACTRPAATKGAVVTPGTPGPTLSPTPAPVGVKPGTTAPEFNLHTHVGEELRLSGLRGQAVILYFWNTGCQACSAEMTALQDLYTRNQQNGLVVVGINNREQSLTVGDYGKNLNISYPLLLDREGTIADMYLVKSFPAAFFVDRNGIITDVQNKAMKAEDIEAMAQKIIASVATIPTMTPTTPPITSLEGCITADALNVRAGPGTDNAAIRLIPNGDCAQFDARNGDSTWLRLAEPQENPRQWVSAEYVELKGEIDSLPVGE